MDALIHHLEEKQDLSSREVEVAAELLLDPAAPDEKKARLLEALALKGETAAEIAGFVEAFLEHAVDPHLGLLGLEGPTLDVCGTGGDQLDLFNVSTTAMFIAAAAGAVVVKHGNRGITSKSGGADVLEALGIRIDLPADEFRSCLEKAGLGFMFAPIYHPAFKAVVARAEIARRAGREDHFQPDRPAAESGPAAMPARRRVLARSLPGLRRNPPAARPRERVGRAWHHRRRALGGRGQPDGLDPDLQIRALSGHGRRGGPAA